MQDGLRGSALRRVPYFNQVKVVRLLDRLPDLRPADQIAIDQILMILLSASVLGERFALEA